MVINEVMRILFSYPSLISGDIIFERFQFPKPHNLIQIHTITYL